MKTRCKEFENSLQDFHGFWAAAPRGPMTHAFTHMVNLLLLLLLLLLLRPPLTMKPKFQPPAHTQALGLLSKSQGSIPIFIAPIPALRLQSQPSGSNPRLKTPIPDSRLQSQPQGSIPAFRLLS